MNRAAALSALDDAFAGRIKTEYDMLADGFMATPNAKEAAKATFKRGVALHLDAFEFAKDFISDTFKE